MGLESSFIYWYIVFGKKWNILLSKVKHTVPWQPTRAEFGFCKMFLKWFFSVKADQQLVQYTTSDGSPRIPSARRRVTLDASSACLGSVIPVHNQILWLHINFICTTPLFVNLVKKSSNKFWVLYYCFMQLHLVANSFSTKKKRKKKNFVFFEGQCEWSVYLSIIVYICPHHKE